MDLLTILLLAFGLAMDCFAVSVAEGTISQHLRVRHILRMAFFFGFFQGLMPLIGYLAGAALVDYIAGYHHWVAFGLLVGLGVKMIYEAFVIEQAERKPNAEDFAMVLMLALATSIDALAGGVTLSVLHGPVIRAAAIIAVITFVVSTLGFYVGRRFGHLFESKAEIFAGLVLIGLGLKVLIGHFLEHGFG